MNINKHFTIRPNWNIVKAVLTILFLSSYLVSVGFARPSKAITGRDKFIISGSEFYQRSQFDAGEIRIFLKNTGNEPISVSQCKLGRLPAGQVKDSNEVLVEVNYLYSKSAPLVLMPGQNGELLIKLLEVPPNNSRLKCTVYADTSDVSEVIISIEQVPVWIPFVGFSEDLSKVYVYVRNNTQQPLKAELLKVAGTNAADNYRSTNGQILPGDKGCLIFKMPTPLTLGEYVHVAVSAASKDQKWKMQRIVRAVNKFPLMFSNGASDPKLGLDSERFFIRSTFLTADVSCIQNMVCPAHAHGTHNDAAGKFLDSYYSIFSQNPCLLMQMGICRSDKPRAWYEFGPLPDVAVMNPILLEPRAHEADTKASKRFHPFFWLATTAKKAAAPNRYLACIPLEPEDTVFLQDSHTPDEIRFLAYCAIAAGAKGILYRGKPASDQLSQDGFIRLNKELQQLKPLLTIAEPVNWASTADNSYAAKSLLCGNEAILVMVFDRRYFGQQENNRLYTPAFEKRGKSVKIKVTVPEESLISEVKSIYRPLPNKLWNCRDGQLDFTANMVNSVQIYKLILAQENNEAGLKGTVQPCKNEDIH